MIITGPKGKTLHKEELTLSQAEKDVHHRIKTNAPQQQRHASNKLAKTTSQASAASNPPHNTQDTTLKHKTHSQDTTNTSQDTSKVYSAWYSPGFMSVCSHCFCLFYLYQ